MPDRDVERDVPAAAFAAKLRRIADAVEAGEGFRIQVAGTRFTVPAGAHLSVEHEVTSGDEELELQLKWSSDDD
jgi:amphi-Trp domain-containing protein